MERVYFTGVPENDWPLLLRLDYPSLLSGCQTNSYINSICEDESFWRDKVNQDFGVAQYKPTGTYRQQYDFLYRLPQIPVVTPSFPFSQRTDAIVALILRGSKVDLDFRRLALRRGRLPILQAMHRQGATFNRSDLLIAASEGQLPVLEWLLPIGVRPDQELAEDATASDSTKVLDWLEAQGLTPTVRGANIAIQTCAIESLDWLEERGILPDIEGANSAAEHGCVSGLDWLEERDILPNQEGVEAGYESGDPDIISWFQERGLTPEFEGA